MKDYQALQREVERLRAAALSPGHEDCQAVNGALQAEVERLRGAELERAHGHKPLHLGGRACTLDCIEKAQPEVTNPTDTMEWLRWCAGPMPDCDCAGGGTGWHQDGCAKKRWLRNRFHTSPMFVAQAVLALVEALGDVKRQHPKS